MSREKKKITIPKPRLHKARPLFRIAGAALLAGAMGCGDDSGDEPDLSSKLIDGFAPAVDMAKHD